MVVAYVSERPPREDIPAYHGHEAGFIRICLHVCYRVQHLGIEIRPGALCGGYTYGLSVAQRSMDALGNEPARCADMLFRDIMNIKPPAAFTQLWTDDFLSTNGCLNPRKDSDP